MSQTTPKTLAVFALGVGLGACAPKKDTASPDPGGGDACTEDAKVCADGSSVGREGPDCEFAACPEDAAGDDAIDEAAGDDEAADADAEPASDDEAPADEAAADSE